MTTLSKVFTRAASTVAHAAGRPTTFMLCVLVIVVWAVSGPIFGYSDTWQLIINTGTTIITFLMVFLIQNTQNRDGAAVQTKLDELIRTSRAQNAFVGIENLTDEELEAIRKKCEERAKTEDQGEDEIEKNPRKAKFERSAKAMEAGEKAKTKANKAADEAVRKKVG